MRLINTTLLAILFAGLIITQPCGAQTFQDGTFLDADWTITFLNFNHPTGGSSAHETSGGNPSDHRSITHGACSGNNPCRIWTVGMRAGATYNPPTEGPLTSVCYSEDQRCQSADGCVGGGMSARPAILQGGVIYVAAASNTGVLNNWTTMTLSGLGATDFGELDPSTSPIVDFGSNPDFSASGSLIQFGFARGNSLSSARTSGIDNWMFELQCLSTPTEQVSWSAIKVRHN